MINGLHETKVEPLAGYDQKFKFLVTCKDCQFNGRAYTEDAAKDIAANHVSTREAISKRTF